MALTALSWRLIVFLLVLAGPCMISGCGSSVPSAGELPPDPAPATLREPEPQQDRIAKNAQTESLRRAAQWLWQQQGEDGGWHSGNYAVLRSGQAYTPFVLHLLLSIPEEEASRPLRGVERALEFIRSRLNDDGALGFRDPDLLEYPSYSTAYALRSLVLAGQTEDRARIVKMRDWLVRQQFAEAAGFAPSDPAYGSWGFGGERRPGSPGYLDLAHTRRVLQALRESADAGFGDKSDQEVFQRAELFLRLLQRRPDETRPQPLPADLKASGPAPYDGGFYFSPIVLAANKGGLVPAEQTANPFYRSYATTTCDGAIALLMTGETREDSRVADAARWLEEHPRLDQPEGVPADESAPWGDALHFYHFAARSELYAALDWPGNWRTELRLLLAAEQQADGSFRNSRSPLMKADDPVLATTLAAMALGSIAGRHR